jgi:hypothetical protein
VSHGPTPHHLREQERRERPFGLSTGDTPQTEAGVVCHCSLQIVLHERLTDSVSLSRPDSMITFKLSRDRVFRQRVSIYIRHDLAALSCRIIARCTVPIFRSSAPYTAVPSTLSLPIKDAVSRRESTRGHVCFLLQRLICQRLSLVCSSCRPRPSPSPP